MKRYAIAAAALVATLALAGCGGEYNASGNVISVVTVDVDGTPVNCVTSSGGGLDCDW